MHVHIRHLYTCRNIVSRCYRCVGARLLEELLPSRGTRDSCSYSGMLSGSHLSHLLSLSLTASIDADDPVDDEVCTCCLRHCVTWCGQLNCCAILYAIHYCSSRLKSTCNFIVIQRCIVEPLLRDPPERRTPLY